MNTSSGMWLGLVLIFIGVMLLLDNLYMVDFGEILHIYWPVLLIVWGLNKLLRRSPSLNPQESSSAKVDGATSRVYANSDANYLVSSTVFGDYSVVIQSKSFGGGAVSTTFGNTDIDLLNAQLADGEHSLKLSGMFGNTTLHIPKGMAFVVFANTTFGDIRVNDQHKEGISSSLDYASSDFDTSNRRLRISVSRVFGNVIVVA